MLRDIFNQVRFGFFAGLLRMELIRNGSHMRWLVVFESIIDIILTWQDCETPSLRWAFSKDLEKFTKSFCKNYEQASMWEGVLHAVVEDRPDVVGDS